MAKVSIKFTAEIDKHGNIAHLSTDFKGSSRPQIYMNSLGSYDFAGVGKQAIRAAFDLEALKPGTRKEIA